MLFKELNLDGRLLKAVEASGFSEPTEIQRQAIPVVLSGRGNPGRRRPPNHIHLSTSTLECCARTIRVWTAHISHDDDFLFEEQETSVGIRTVVLGPRG